jgi:hypothetical protein
MRRVSAITIGCSAAVVVLAVPAAAAQVPPPTLNLELFTAAPFMAVGSIAVTSATCNPAGDSSFRYRVSGSASTPYQGTFTETGTVTMGPQNISNGSSNPNGLLTGWTASFTITSPTGSVTGTKSLPAGATDTLGICTTASQSPVGLEEYAANVVMSPGLAYRATITISDAQFGDHGNSFSVTFTDIPILAPVTTFEERFTSQQLTTTPLCNQDSQTNQDQVGNHQGCANS